MPVEVHQLLPNLDYGDAISNHAMEIRAILRSHGYNSNIYARYIHPKVAGECFPYKEHLKRSSPNNIVVFHHSIGSEVSEYVKTLPDRKIMIYHNITPGHFFAPYDSHLTHLLIKGREDLKEFVGVPILALGDSEYNADELRNVGYPNVEVLPIITNFKNIDIPPDERTIRKYNGTATNILFVGRVSPNKKQEDIIKTFCFYQRYINPDSRLFLVGSCQNPAGYYNSLLNIIKKLDVKNVIFTDHTTQQELAAYYKLGNVFLSMSEHEGFGVPLLEAMHFHIPVLAFSSSAVPETMGDAGILFKEKRHEEIAELINLVATNSDVRGRIISSQNKRLLDFDARKIGEKLMSFIETVKSL